MWCRSVGCAKNLIRRRIINRFRNDLDALVGGKTYVSAQMHGFVYE